MLAEVCGSPLIKEVAKRAEKQLGRKLQPHDLWFAGFRPRGTFSEGELDALTRKRYPTAQSFEAALPSILQKLDFAPDKAKFLAEPVELRGRVPPRSVVIPGMRPKRFPAGEYMVPCALIIGQRSASTDRKTSLEDTLRQHAVAV